MAQLFDLQAPIKTLKEGQKFTLGELNFVVKTMGGESAHNVYAALNEPTQKAHGQYYWFPPEIIVSY